MTTYWLEGSNFGFLLLVVNSILHVIDGQSSVGCLESIISDIVNALVAPVLCSEVENCSPII